MSILENLIIEEASWSQLDKILAILRQDNLLRMLKLDELKDSLMEGETILVAITPNEDIVGVVWCCDWELSTRGIDGVVVDREHRNKGIGSMLLKFVDPTEDIPKNYMSIADDDFNALNFLKKRGYVATREVKFGDDIRYIMQKEYDKPKEITLRNRLKWRKI